MSGAPSRGAALTGRAVAGWLAALPAARYDLRLVPAEGNGAGALRRAPSAEGLLRLVPMLRARSAKGFHIYARPADPAYLMIDDLDQDGLDALRAAGHRPAAVVQTSPHSFQAWLRLAEPGQAVPPALSSAAARLAARRFGGDPGAASCVQVGRLPGFTNLKPAHERGDGSYPFALLVSAWGGQDPGAPLLLAEAARQLGGARRPEGLVPTPRAAGRVARLRPCTPGAEYAEAERRVREALPSGGSLDRSRLDHAIACRLLGRGASPAYVRAVLAAGERAADLGDGAEAYVARTLSAALRPRG